MGAIKTDELLEQDIREEIEFSTYPALLLGRMGVDREFQCRGVGSSILMHCLGLAQKINDDIACSALMLHTTRDVSEYYRKKGFKNIEPDASKRLITMYKLV
jgi:GNAT superfamily N-acetyltransferase